MDLHYNLKRVMVNTQIKDANNSLLVSECKSKKEGTKKWYLVQCKSGQENRAVENLENQGFICYKPELITEKIIKGKLTKKTIPLFPGYIFIELNKVSSNWAVIRSTRGVLRLVSFGKEPIPVETQIVEHFKKTEGGFSKTLFNKGAKIKITDGPFAQLDAIFEESDGDKRAIVLLNLLNKWHRVKLPLKQLSA